MEKPGLFVICNSARWKSVERNDRVFGPGWRGSNRGNTFRATGYRKRRRGVVEHAAMNGVVSVKRGKSPYRADKWSRNVQPVATLETI